LSLNDVTISGITGGNGGYCAGGVRGYAGAAYGVFSPTYTTFVNYEVLQLSVDNLVAGTGANVSPSTAKLTQSGSAQCLTAVGPLCYPLYANCSCTSSSTNTTGNVATTTTSTAATTLTSGSTTSHNSTTTGALTSSTTGHVNGTTSGGQTGTSGSTTGSNGATVTVTVTLVISGNNTNSTYLNSVAAALLATISDELDLQPDQTITVVWKIQNSKRATLATANSNIVFTVLITIPESDLEGDTTGAGSLNTAALSASIISQLNSSSALQTYLSGQGLTLTGIKATTTVTYPSTTTTTTGSSSGMSKAEKNRIIIGVVVGVVGAAIVAVAAFLIVRKRSHTHMRVASSP